MSTVTFTCDISAPVAAALGLKIRCNGVIAAEYLPVDSGEFSYEFTDTVDTQSHTIEFIMSGKTTEHTVLDAQGNIVQDHLILIKNKRFENIDVDYAFDSHAAYTHDFNGTGESIQDTFCGIMGCNGTVKFEFTTPIYLWMLENL